MLLSDEVELTFDFTSDNPREREMPRSFLLAANINPEKDFRRIAYSGAHDATIASVVSGKVDAAALDITVWKDTLVMEDPEYILDNFDDVSTFAIKYIQK